MAASLSGSPCMDILIDIFRKAAVVFKTASGNKKRGIRIFSSNAFGFSSVEFVCLGSHFQKLRMSSMKTAKKPGQNLHFRPQFCLFLLLSHNILW